MVVTGGRVLMVLTSLVNIVTPSSQNEVKQPADAALRPHVCPGPVCVSPARRQDAEARGTMLSK